MLISHVHNFIIHHFCYMLEKELQNNHVLGNFFSIKFVKREKLFFLIPMKKVAQSAERYKLVTNCYKNIFINKLVTNNNKQV